MKDIQFFYFALYLASVFLSAVSQVLLKKAALRPHRSMLSEYSDIRVVSGYLLFFICTLLTALAYHGIPMSLGPVLESTGYIYVTTFGVLFFHEKLNCRKVLALALIVFGICVYSL